MEINSKKIRELMKEKGWNNQRLSVASTLSVRTIEVILARKTTKLKTINQLGVLFDVDPKDLLI